MIHICKELKKIINEVEKENQVLSINLIIYEILKMYKEYFGLKKQDIETIYKGNEVDVDAKLQFTASSGRHSVLERPFSEANGRPFVS